MRIEKCRYSVNYNRETNLVVSILETMSNADEVNAEQFLKGNDYSIGNVWLEEHLHPHFCIGKDMSLFKEKHIKLTFDNPTFTLWHKAAGGELYQIIYMTEQIVVIPLYAVVSSFDGYDCFALNQTNAIKSDLSKGLYIKADGLFCEIKLISSDHKEINAAMNANNNVALIATDQSGLHYLAQIDPTKT